MSNLAALVQPSQPWKIHAACLGLRDKFYPPGQVRPPSSKQSRALKRICHSCPVSQECLTAETAAEQLTGALGEPAIDWWGIYGGADIWERRALVASDEEMQARLNRLLAKYGPDGAQDLREATMQEGPSADQMEGKTLPEIVDAFGVPPKVASAWCKKRGVEPVVERRPWDQALVDLVSDGEWHDRSEVIAVMAEAVPTAYAQAKIEDRIKKGRMMSEPAARRWIANTSLWAWTGRNDPTAGEPKLLMRCSECGQIGKRVPPHPDTQPSAMQYKINQARQV